MTMRSLALAGLTIFAAAAGIRATHADEPAFARETIDVGMVVSDVATSVKFYTEAIGFTERTGFKVDGSLAVDSGLMEKAEELDVHVLTLGTADTATRLKLIQFKAEPKAGANAAVNSQLGYRYLTIMVTDTNAALARLKKYGAKPLAKGPAEIPKDILPGGVFLTVVRDPDGNLVELVGPKK